MTLPPLNPDARCPKCGGEQVSMLYRESYCLPGACGVRYGNPAEHIDRVCQRCHHIWAEDVFRPTKDVP